MIHSAEKKKYFFQERIEVLRAKVNSLSLKNSKELTENLRRVSRALLVENDSDVEDKNPQLAKSVEDRIEEELQNVNAEIEQELAEIERAARKQYALSAVAAIVSGVGVWYGAEKLCQVSAVTSIAAASLVGVAVGFAAYKMCSKKDVERDMQDQRSQSSAGSEQFGI